MNTMKQRQLPALMLVLAAVVFVSCTRENISLQNPKFYSDQYYANLRAYKKSNHQLCFGWYADYAQTFSYGMHFMGLPDSMDIISLWGGIPDKVKTPETYEEMR